MPSLSVVQTVPSRRRNEAPALSSPPNPRLPSTRPRDEPLEPDRHLEQAAPEVGGDAIEHRARDQRLADGDVRAPVATSAEQVRDRHGQEMVRVHQPGARRDDPVPVGVGVVGEGDIEPVAQLDQPRHRVRRRRVHPDPAVPVAGHEPELRVDDLVGDRQVEAVAVADRRPVGDAGAAERVHAEPKPGAADGVHVDDRGEVVDVAAHEVVGGRPGARLLDRDAPDAVEIRLDQPVRLVLDRRW